jgi:hypothetical protein
MQDFFQYTEGKKMGIKNELGDIVIPAIYDFVVPLSDGLFTVREGGHTAYFDEKGNIALPFDNRYETYGNFTEGLARVQMHGKWGFINKNGEAVIAPQFYYADAFSNGMAIVRNAHDLHGAIDTSGNLVVGYRFAHLTSFVRGYAKFGDLQTWGLIDKTGQVVVPQQYIFIGDVYNKQVTVQVQQGDEYKEGVLTIGGSITWNNNLDHVNIFNKKKEAFSTACQQLIRNMYQTGCPCSYERMRHFIQWNKPVGFIDQEILFSALEPRLQRMTDDLLQCPVCGTCYRQKWEQYSAFLWVLNVAITAGNFVNRGAPVTYPVPIALGFYGYDTNKYSGQYEEQAIATVIGYLQAM